MPFTALCQVADTSAAPEESQWLANPAYLFSAPTGRNIGQGEVLVGVRAIPVIGDERILGPKVLLNLGVTDRITLMSGYLFQTYGDEFQDGEAAVGASVNLGSAEAPFAIQAEANLPINHYLGRRLGEVVITGARQWGDTRRALTAGGGWRGSRSLCRAEWEGCEQMWNGDWFALFGGYLSLNDNVQFVSENYLRSGSIGTLNGIRAGIGGLTVDVAFGCRAYVGFGVGADCDDGLQLGGSYRLDLTRR
jgi:hypothetical protein